MESQLKIYNTLTRETDVFKPIHEGFVGMYVCGPTVYSNAHLGNARTFVSFDIVYRYLLHLGYKVRYVRNITDVGHLESDADEGEDKIGKKAKAERLEPMEIVQRYTIDFHQVMQALNTLPPSVEPTATGHIIEQIEMTKQIIDNGYGYEVDGTIYFDVEKFAGKYNYTALTGRKLDDLLENTRDLDGQEEKKGRLDFALWKKAKPEHIMRWNSPWGAGFPGWHIECSAMSKKYLGDNFDIHGGGMDLAPTHHTNEIAQNVACSHQQQPVNYWMHTNMLTVNGQKMSKSLGNSFLPFELFTGTHPLLDKGYSPMAVRFFMLQAHYRSTLDITNEALQASERGFARLCESYKLLKEMDVTQYSQSAGSNDAAILAQLQLLKAYMDDDFNTPKVIAVLFELASYINKIKHENLAINGETVFLLQRDFKAYFEDVLGLQLENEAENNATAGLMQLIIDIRKAAREKKDFATSDQIRDTLTKLRIQLKDGKEGTTWTINS